MSVKYEKSCGAVVFTRTTAGTEYVIIRSLEGYYGFPKGHCEAGETEEETALREIREETGLTVRLIPGFRLTDVYPIPKLPGVMKQVVYFLAEYAQQEIQSQKEELSDACLMTYETAIRKLYWESSKVILTKANDYLSTLEKNHARDRLIF